MRVLTFLDRWIRSRHATKLEVAVFSVGNLTVGGTGKTPWVIKLTKDLQSLGEKPAILTRGYKGFLKGSGPGGDETLLMEEKCPNVPVGVGANRRHTAAQIFRKARPSVYVLDDGFQHWPLRRDVDVVCVDATDPWGGGFGFPCGRLREPVGALQRAHAVVITRTDLISKEQLTQIEAQIRSVAPQIKIFPSCFFSILWSMRDGKEKDLSELKGQRVMALSALGHPQGFETALDHVGAHVTPFRFQDHHSYSEEDAVTIETKLKNEDLVLVTTEKDWVKLNKTKIGRKGFVLKIEAKLNKSDEARWVQFLKKGIDEAKTSH